MKYQKDIVVKWFAEHGIFAIPEFRFFEERRWRFDFILTHDHGTNIMRHRSARANKLALEVQGGLFTGGRHSRGPALLKEHEKLNEAAALGWRVLFTTPDQLCMQETVDLIKRALNA